MRRRLIPAALVASLVAWCCALSSAPSSAAAPAARFEVVAAAPQHTGEGGNVPITVRFSGDLAASTPLPSLTPRVSGSWRIVRNLAIFRPAGAYPPGTVVTVAVPGGPGGVTSVAGRHLRSGFRFEFGTRDGSLVSAEQILAELGYLPVRFVPGVPRATSLAAAERDLYTPRPGRFVWSWDAPGALRALFRPGAPGVVVRGALMSFESTHALPVTGALSPAVWSDLLAASRALGRWRSPVGYSYALASKVAPERFTLYHDGRVLLSSPANTGIAAAPTADGSYPVYLRLASQVMRGTNPDGTPYADPVAWVAYFNGGDAVHYIARADYGIPQSLGCVELPYAAAAAAWPYLGIGTIVTLLPVAASNLSSCERRKARPLPVSPDTMARSAAWAATWPARRRRGQT